MHTDGGLQKEGRKKIKGKALKTVEYVVNHATLYTYDNGGNILSKTEYAYTTGTLGEYNPLRYRGYVYDTETGLYYLNSRYYNPETGRFINADSVIDRSKILGANVFSYCFYGAVDVYGHIQNRTSNDCDKEIYFVAKDMVPHHKWNW